jgi:hypothetical protein
MMCVLIYVYISESTAHMLGVVRSIDKEKKRTQVSKGIDPVC